MECEECKKEIHKHMDDIDTKREASRDKAEFLDSLDCKNVIDQYNQCICQKWSEMVKEVLSGSR